MTDEGYIKFHCQWQAGELTDPTCIDELNRWRQALYNRNLIGMDEAGIGFGNVSHRLKGNEFIITGSATGGLKQLTQKHYALVTQYDISRNCLTCTGPVKASSESLSHAAVYQALPRVNAVVHVHHHALWQQLLHKGPTTPAEATYGTPEIARAIHKLVSIREKGQKPIIIMGGHRDGIITYGRNLREAVLTILNLLDD